MQEKINRLKKIQAERDQLVAPRDDYERVEVASRIIARYRADQETFSARLKDETDPDKIARLKRQLDAGRVAIESMSDLRRGHEEKIRDFERYRDLLNSEIEQLTRDLGKKPE